MSAGSAFASGVRAGQNIWNSAVQNAMAGKRMDMLKTQFTFEQAQRKKAVEDQVAGQNALGGYLSSIPTNVDFTSKYDRDIMENASNEFFPDIIRDPASYKQYEAFNTNLGKLGNAELWNKIKNRRDGIEATWLEWNNGMNPPTVENNGVVETDYNLMASMNKDHEAEVGEKTELRKDDFLVIKEWNKKFPGEKFPVVDLPRLPGEPAPETPVKDFAAAKMLMHLEDERLDRDKAIAAAETKDEVEYRGGFNTWRKLLKNPALDATNPEDQKSYRTWAQDEEISGLMAKAGLEAFKLSDELIPDPVSGGYENMAQVTGMINDMIRAQEEEAGERKTMLQKPPTESQAKDYIFSGRLMLMEQTISKLEASGFKPESIANNVGMNWLPEFGKTDDQKRYIAARANWIAAVLRRESGAAIAESEYKGGFEQYFPLVNDSPTVIADKRNARRQVQRDMRATATNQTLMSGYETSGEPVTYNNIAEVEAAVSRGRLKVGDTYRYKTELGEIQNGVVQPPAP
jgi:hypothetical protein